MLRKTFFISAFLIFANMVYAQRNFAWAVPIETKTVNNLYMVDTGVYRCAQPNKTAFAELEIIGISEVLNLRYLCSDKRYVKATDLTVHHVKMLAGKSDFDKLVKTLRIVKNRTDAIVIHCKHGADRTGLVLALYRIVFQDWSRQDAIDELENGNYKFHPVYKNIPEFIKNVDLELLKEAIMQ
jgi:protein tyrosine phosphatase